MIDGIIERLEELLDYIHSKAGQPQEETGMHLVLERQKKILERQFRKFSCDVTSWMFGYRIHPITGLQQHHNGIDLPEKEGVPVMTPWDGKVSAAWSDIGGKNINGKAIKIRHLGCPADETAYAHLVRFADWIGKDVEVKAGQVIGYVGETGRATGAHLHFITRKYVDGKRTDIDPLPLLAAAVGMSEIPVHDVG